MEGRKWKVRRLTHSTSVEGFDLREIIYMNIIEINTRIMHNAIINLYLLHDFSIAHSYIVILKLNKQRNSRLAFPTMDKQFNANLRYF